MTPASTLFLYTTLFRSAMGLMWISGTVSYGIGSNLTGALGPVIGWPLLMCSMILTATSWVFFSGEWKGVRGSRSEEHTSELQSRGHLVCRLLLEKKNVT